MSDSPEDAAITDYLSKLQRAKRTLPHGQLVCIAASPNISTSESLLRFADVLGPYMAVLQLQADIIDDWSPSTAAQLETLADRHAFLLWEGGRTLLDAPKCNVNAEDSSTEVQSLIDIAKKKYTKGVVNIASWANMATSYLMIDDSSGIDGPPAEGSDESAAYSHGMALSLSMNSKLASTLKKAARDVVSSSTKTFSTEISAGEHPNDDNDKHVIEGEAPKCATTGPAEQDDGVIMASLRKPSMIAMTQTITQVTEVAYDRELEATEAVVEDFAGHWPPPVSSSVTGSTDSNPSTGATTPRTPPQLTSLPPPPLKARAMIIALSSMKGPMEESYTELSKRLKIQRGDFVAGAISARPWIPVSCLNGRRRPYDAMTTGRTVLMFAPLERAHVFPKSGTTDDKNSSDLSEQAFDFMGDLDKTGLSMATPAQQDQIRMLHCMIGRALRMREAVLQKTPQTTPLIPGQRTLYIPIVTMNL